MVRIKLLLILAAMLCSEFISEPAFSNDGYPVAVFVEPNGTAIETMGGFRIEIDKANGSKITVSELSDVRTSVFQSAHQLSHAQNEQNSWRLSRPVNQLKSVCEQEPLNKPLTGNAVSIRQQKLETQGELMTWIETDGVVILDLGKNPIEDESLLPEVKCDIVVTTLCPDANTKSIERLVNKLKPQIILIAADNDAVEDAKVTAIEGRNVIAISVQQEKADTRWIKIPNQPWKMPESELSELFEKKEKSSAQSRAVFAELSVDQMNFVPGNGSHTPRWNTEHMMGRELLFFSQIYHSIDPMIPVMNLNPKQMPKDYVAAHPDWTGHEEALLTLQVEAFSRRFAYLLQGLPLDKKVGSKMWSPRGLLKQMDRHYHEHTENVKKKMELENWPAK